MGDLETTLIDLLVELQPWVKQQNEEHKTEDYRLLYNYNSTQRKETLVVERSFNPQRRKLSLEITDGAVTIEYYDTKLDTPTPLETTDNNLAKALLEELPSKSNDTTRYLRFKIKNFFYQPDIYKQEFKELVQNL